MDPSQAGRPARRIYTITDAGGSVLALFMLIAAPALLLTRIRASARA